MSNWKTVVTTTKGLALLSKLAAGSALTLTRILSGAGRVPKDSLRDQTAVTDPRQQLLKYPVKTRADARAEIPVLLRSTGVVAPYTVHQIGVYALDPEEGEILFFLAQDAAGEEIPAETGSPLFSLFFTFVSQLGGASRVILRMAPEEELTKPLAQTLFAPLSHVEEGVPLQGGAHGFRFNEANRIFEKRDPRTGAWVPIAVGAPKLREIAVTTPPAKTAYHIGEVFQPEGMVVTALYTQSISTPVTGYQVTPDRPLTISDDHVTLSFTDDGVTKTAELAITVGELMGIDIVTPPDRAEFVSGFCFDPVGMTVRALYANGSTQMVTDRVTYSPSGPLLMSDDAVTVSYTEEDVTVTAAQAITVIRCLEAISVLTPPAKTEYAEGESFDAMGMTLQALYNDGTTAAVTSYHWWPTEPLGPEETAVTVSYVENGVIRETLQPIAIRPKIHPVFGENSWDVIGEQARLIAAGGTIPKGWKLGDIKVSTPTEEAPYLFQIVGFNMDTNSETGGKAGISLMTKDLSATAVRFNKYVSSGRLNITDCELYKTVTTTVYDALPEDLKRWMVPTIRYSTYGNTGNAKPYHTNIWIPLYMELHNTNSWPDVPFVQYHLFSQSPDITTERLKYEHGTSSGTAYPYWTSDIYSNTLVRIVTETGEFLLDEYRNATHRYCIGVCLG